jgi:nucleoside-diphosphate-sugar epimerase
MSGKLHVVVGAGSIGSGIARLLAEQGESVRVVTRSGSGPDHPRIEKVAADAGNADRLSELATGASAIYNAVNPPYHRWETDWPPVSNALLAAAERSGAVLAACSNLYVYGPVEAPMTEETPLAATGAKGGVRIRMWEDAIAAHRAGRIRYTEVRGSDYLGARAQSHFTPSVLKALLAGKTARFLGRPDVEHTWTHDRDVARTLVTVAGDERGHGRAWHVPSHQPRTIREVMRDLAGQAGVAEVPVKQIPVWAQRAMSPFVPFLREMPEVLHQHTRPWVMDSSAAQATFGLEPTPWPDIVTEVLAPYRAERAAA